MFDALSLSSSHPVITKQSVTKAKSSNRVFIQWQVTRGILRVKNFHAVLLRSGCARDGEHHRHGYTNSLATFYFVGESNNDLAIAN